MNTDALLDQFERMTLLDLTAFRAAFEERFGVAPAPVIAPAPAAVDVIDPADEDAPVTLTLTGSGDRKIQVIKAVRELVPNLGLKEAKTLVDEVPAVVLDGVDRDRADQARARLEAAGATVAVRPTEVVV